MNKKNTTLAKAKRLLAQDGYSIRLATMEEKRALAKDYKKGNYLPCSYGRLERKHLRDVYDHFKKDVWVVFSKNGHTQFWSSRTLVRAVRHFGRCARYAKDWNRKNFKRKTISWRDHRELIDEPEVHTYLHFCENCPEYCDWEDYKKNYRNEPLTNSPLQDIL